MFSIALFIIFLIPVYPQRQIQRAQDRFACTLCDLGHGNGAIQGFQHYHIIDLGPLDPTILNGQDIHQSSLAWTSVDLKELYCRHCEAIFHHTSAPYRRIIPLLGFYRVAHLGFISSYWHLIIVYIERWRLETHNFHLPKRECTITVHDITIVLKLLVDGIVVIGSTCLDWRHVSSLLSLITEDTYIDGQCLHVTWLGQSFPILTLDVDEQSIWHYTEAYILQLLRGFLFQKSLEIRCILCFNLF